MNYNDNIVAEFIPGSKWLYYKLYCGTTIADKILINTINPLVKELIKTEQIASWFFIRYNDPDFHIRVRFCLKDEKHLGAVLKQAKQLFLPYTENRLIWKIQLDTYKRELSRYGTNTMELSEQFFFYDSQYILDSLGNLSNDTERCMFSMQHILSLFRLFNLTVDQSLLFVKNMRESYKEEFNADKKHIKQLDIKYRALNKNHLLANTTNYFTKAVNPIAKQLLIYKTANSLQVELESLLSSFIHMSVNRIFKTEQRLYEFICYEFLYKVLKSEKSIEQQ